MREAFIHQMEQEPLVALHRHVYADWLMENPDTYDEGVRQHRCASMIEDALQCCQRQPLVLVSE